jgi:hypothetical protein
MKSVANKIRFPKLLDERAVAYASLTAKFDNDFSQAFRGLSRAHSGNSGKDLEMKSAVTEKCSVLLEMFNSALDLIAEKFATEGWENWELNVTLMLG